MHTLTSQDKKEKLRTNHTGLKMAGYVCRFSAIKTWKTQLTIVLATQYSRYQNILPSGLATSFQASVFLSLQNT